MGCQARTGCKMRIYIVGASRLRPKHDRAALHQMSGEKTEMRRIRQMSVTAVGELPLPEHLRRLNGFSEP